MEYCSPSKKAHFKTHKTCFDDPAVRRIIEAYNREHPNDPIRTQNLSFKNQLKLLKKRFEKNCGNNESCIISSLKLDEDTLIDDYVRPKMPDEWKNDPNTWLSNFNIEAVLIQYEDAYRPFYKFFGVYSADFLRLSNGRPSHPELYNIDIKTMYKDHKIQTFGLVINLDDHDEPGSHWTSLFVCIDPSMHCYGAYYYDSTANDPPVHMQEFMNKLKEQADKGFKLRINKRKHQYGSTECGIFSIYNQIKWMYEAKDKNGKITFNKLMSEKETDTKMTELRKKLFRPL
jgi:hypothetical protein